MRTREQPPKNCCYRKKYFLCQYGSKIPSASSWTPIDTMRLVHQLRLVLKMLPLLLVYLLDY